MDFFPFFFDLKQRDCLIVGGGNIAVRKARLISKAGAKITVVAKSILPELLQIVEDSQGHFFEGEYQESFTHGKTLVIAATDDELVNAQVSHDCQARNIPVNVVDTPHLCTIITPAIVDRSPLIIGITSGGDAPVLARKVRTQLESSVPASYGYLGKLASEFRNDIKSAMGDEDSRRRFWESFFDGPIPEKVLNGQVDAARADLKTLIENLSVKGNSDAEQSGEVYLVGAGPGDPDLLTFKALRLMQKAEVVLYDRLVSQPILEMTRRDAERIYVGKRRADHAMPQNDINQLLLKLAQEGKRVLRLKGGDPFIFGRGGEEIDLLAQHNIPFQVVPGITAASGCAAYSGIPLTHRDYSQSVRFITGHLKRSPDDSTGKLLFDWSEFKDKHQTLVFYMGLTAIDEICSQLINCGREKTTPVALIERGTLPDHRTHIADLETMPALVKKTQAKAPTLLIIGDVVKLHKDLSWYKNDI